MERLKKTNMEDQSIVTYKINFITTDEDIVEMFRRINASGKCEIKELIFVDTQRFFSDQSYSGKIDDDAEQMVSKIDDCDIGLVTAISKIANTPISISVNTGTYQVAIGVPMGDKKAIGKIEQVFRSIDK